MRKTIVALMCTFVLFGVWLRAADQSGDAQVRELEARLRAAETELKKAKELLTAIKTPPNNAATLEGVWRIVSVDGNRPGGKFVKPPYDEYKIMTAGHYLWLSFDQATGRIIRSGGGTYTLDGEKYAAHVDFSNANDLRAVIGQTYKGTCRLEGKRWYHYGRMTNGASFDELWERVH